MIEQIGQVKTRITLLFGDDEYIYIRLKLKVFDGKKKISQNTYALDI